MRGEIVDVVDQAVAPIGPYVKQISLGIGCLILSLLCFVFTLIFLAASLFFYFVPNLAWSGAAWWTGLISGGVGALWLAGGLSFLKKPYNATS